MAHKPEPKPVDPEEVPALAAATMAAARFPVLATVDGDAPRARPVSPIRTDGFTVYVANLRSYHKTGEISAKPGRRITMVPPKPMRMAPIRLAWRRSPRKRAAPRLVKMGAVKPIAVTSAMGMWAMA